MKNPFRYFNSSPEVIRLTVMMYVRYPLSLRQVEDLLFERGIDICHETVRFWWNRFGPMFAVQIRKRRVHQQSYSRRILFGLSDCWLIISMSAPSRHTVAGRRTESGRQPEFGEGTRCQSGGLLV
jgi:putative transposase